MPDEYFKVKCIKTLSNWDILPRAHESCLGEGRRGVWSSVQPPLKGWIGPRGAGFSDLHAASPAGSQHGLAGRSSVTSPARDDPQSTKICNIG